MTDKTEALERADRRIANALRDVVNEALARYDVPSDVYEQDVLIDAACVCAADKILREREDVAQAMVAAAYADCWEQGKHAGRFAPDVPADARAALDRMIAEAMDAEREACALIAENRHKEWNHPDTHGKPEVCDDITACENISARTRALTPGGARAALDRMIAEAE